MRPWGEFILGMWGGIMVGIGIGHALFARRPRP